MGIHSSDLVNFGVTADSMSSSTPKFTKSPTSNTANLNHSENPPTQTHKGEMADLRLRHDLKLTKLNRVKRKPYKAL